METERVKRKISAILSADVVGYGRLMGDDEAATVKSMESYRETITALVEQYGGRVVDSPGDNILSEFPSVVDAAQCAVEIQRVIKARNDDLPKDRRMVFRIGINLGDVIEEGKRIYGDGVNIAARIEALAEPGGICISGSAYEQIETKLALGYVNIGDHSLKNVSRPVRVYKIPMDPGEIAEAEKQRRSAPMPASGRDMQPGVAAVDAFPDREPANPDDYYIGGYVCLGLAVGMPVFGYFIGRIAPEAFWPLVGIGPLLGLIGGSLILCGKLIARRAKPVESGDRRK